MKQENFVENIPGILLLSHGPFCQALLESAQMIGGEAVNVVALPLLENASIDEYGEKAMQTFKQMPRLDRSVRPGKRHTVQSDDDEERRRGIPRPVRHEPAGPAGGDDHARGHEGQRASRPAGGIRQGGSRQYQELFRTVSRVHNFCGREVSTCVEIMCYNLSWKRRRHRILRA